MPVMHVKSIYKYSVTALGFVYDFGGSLFSAASSYIYIQVPRALSEWPQSCLGGPTFAQRSSTRLCIVLCRTRMFAKVGPPDLAPGWPMKLAQWLLVLFSTVGDGYRYRFSVLEFSNFKHVLLALVIININDVTTRGLFILEHAVFNNPIYRPWGIQRNASDRAPRLSVSTFTHRLRNHIYMFNEMLATDTYIYRLLHVASENQNVYFSIHVVWFSALIQLPEHVLSHVLAATDLTMLW
jgi:hypothetical protein